MARTKITPREGQIRGQQVKMREQAWVEAQVPGGPPLLGELEMRRQEAERLEEVGRVTWFIPNPAADTNGGRSGIFGTSKGGANAEEN